MNFGDLKVGEKYMEEDCEAHFMKEGVDESVVIQGCPGYRVGSHLMMWPENEVTQIVYTGVHRMDDNK